MPDQKRNCKGGDAQIVAGVLTVNNRFKLITQGKIIPLSAPVRYG